MKKTNRVPYQITGKSFLLEVILEVLSICVLAVGMRTKTHIVIAIGIVFTLFVMPGHLVLSSLLSRKRRAEEWERQNAEALEEE